MSKESLLLLPGLMCNETVWMPIMDELSLTHECTVIDHGRADSISVMAKNILRQAPPQFALAGHSMGGRVALEVFRLAPHRVTRIALMNTGYLARPDSQAGAKETQGRYDLLKIAIDQGIEAMARQWVQAMVAPKRLSDESFIQSIIEMFKVKSVDIFKHQIAALLNRPDATLVLKSLNVPSLILCSEFDLWSPVQQHSDMAKLMPRQPIWCEIAGAGHMCTMEDPQAVSKGMVEWLNASH
jgi:pimeloyl-ACP methyl ester carboxylesterase